LDWTELDWIGLDWTGLDWTGLDWIGLDWIGLDWIGLDWIGLDWTGLDWIRLDSVCGYAPSYVILGGPQTQSEGDHTLYSVLYVVQLFTISVFLNICQTAAR